jgi:hypothetical protein
MAEKYPGDVDGASHHVVCGWRGLSGTFKIRGLRRRSDVVTGLACTSRDRQSYGYVYNRREVPDDLAIVLLRDFTPGAGIAPRGRGGGTRAVHPGSARRGAPGTPRPALARGPRRSAPRPRWCGAVSGTAGDTVDACGPNGLGEGHQGQDGGEPCTSIMVKIRRYRDRRLHGV